MAEQSVGIRELKQNASAVIARVRSGETLVVTDRGVPVARIIPAGDLGLDGLVEAGLASAPRLSVAEALGGIPAGEPTSMVSDALDELRCDTRS